MRCGGQSSFGKGPRSGDSSKYNGAFLRILAHSRSYRHRDAYGSQADPYFYGTAADLRIPRTREETERTTETEVRLDDSDMVQLYNNNPLNLPSPDALQEFTLLTNAFS